MYVIFITGHLLISLQCGTSPAKRLITENMLDVLKMAEDIMQHENNTSVHTIKQAVTGNMPQYSSNDGQHSDQLTSVHHQKASTDSLLQELDLPDSLDDSSLSSLQSKYSTQSKSSFDSDLNDDYQRKVRVEIWLSFLFVCFHGKKIVGSRQIYHCPYQFIYLFFLTMDLLETPRYDYICQIFFYFDNFFLNIIRNYTIYIFVSYLIVKTNRKRAFELLL